MENSENYRLEQVPAKLIKRIPGLSLGATKRGVGKAKEISKVRGYYRPVVLSASQQGCMALLAGAATYEACLDDKAAKVPAVIVRTDGGADDLMFALQSADLEEAPSAIAISSAIVQLVDAHGIARKQIAETLGKSPAWITRMENLSRRLNATVQKMVLEGYVQPRAAQEIARLPTGVQAEFAASAASEFLNKDEVMYLVNRYLDVDTGAEERCRIVRTPKLALPPDRPKGRGRIYSDNSDSARLSRAIAGCLDSASRLSALLDKADIGAAAIRVSDATALAEALVALHRQLRAFTPG
jgi:hypothetical protein